MVVALVGSSEKGERSLGIVFSRRLIHGTVVLLPVSIVLSPAGHSENATDPSLTHHRLTSAAGQDPRLVSETRIHRT